CLVVREDGRAVRLEKLGDCGASFDRGGIARAASDVQPQSVVLSRDDYELVASVDGDRGHGAVPHPAVVDEHAGELDLRMGCEQCDPECGPGSGGLAVGSDQQLATQ